MSFTATISAVQSALNGITGLSEYADPRVETLASVGGGINDGAYLLKAERFRPWPELAMSAQILIASMRLEVCTILHGDEIDQVGTMSKRGKAIEDALQYNNSLPTGCVFNTQPAEFQRIAKDRRMLWIKRFDIRYEETAP